MYCVPKNNQWPPVLTTSNQWAFDQNRYPSGMYRKVSSPVWSHIHPCLKKARAGEAREDWLLVRNAAINGCLMDSSRTFAGVKSWRHPEIECSTPLTRWAARLGRKWAVKRYFLPWKKITSPKSNCMRYIVLSFKMIVELCGDLTVRNSSKGKEWKENTPQHFKLPSFVVKFFWMCSVTMNGRWPWSCSVELSAVIPVERLCWVPVRFATPVKCGPNSFLAKYQVWAFVFGPTVSNSGRYIHLWLIPEEGILLFVFTEEPP